LVLLIISTEGLSLSTSIKATDTLVVVEIAEETRTSCRAGECGAVTRLPMLGALRNAVAFRTVDDAEPARTLDALLASRGMLHEYLLAPAPG
jgi:hypothetical protein